jgi:hypothetical protein
MGYLFVLALGTTVIGSRLLRVACWCTLALLAWIFG